MAPNELFQYSVISALMDGVASTGVSVSQLPRHGNHGLGTFRHMVGEMILLDGQVFQMRSDGSVTAIDEAAANDAVAPFAMVTQFEPTATVRTAISSKQALADLLTRTLPGTRNHFLAFQVHGVFTLTVRTVGGQTVPHESLRELGRHQATHDFAEVEGTIVGFRSPGFMQGISVVGDHLHFISADRTHGGHVLACRSAGEAQVAAAALTSVRLELPRDDDEYNEARLEADAEGIAAVEG